MYILTLIPARSGSKGIKDKNILDFAGKPLLTHSIDQAKKSKFYKQMKVVVTTDSQKYQQIAKDYGAEVPFLRPEEISGDDSLDFEFTRHALKWLKEHQNYIPDIVLHLRPTQPLRKVEDIDKCLSLFIDLRDKYDSLRSVVKIKKSPFKMYTIEGQELKPLFKQVKNITEPYNSLRQLLPDAYLHNGYIDVFNASIVDQGTISGEKIYPYLMDEDDTVDIDTLEDWEQAIKKTNSLS